MSNAAAPSPPDDLLRVREPVVFEPGRRSPRGSSINAPALFSQNAPHSVYDSLNAAAYSYRLGLNILTIIIVGNVLLLICLLEYFYTDEIENFMKQYREHPTALILFFLAIWLATLIADIFAYVRIINFMRLASVRINVLPDTDRERKKV